MIIIVICYVLLSIACFILVLTAFYEFVIKDIIDKRNKQKEQNNIIDIQEEWRKASEDFIPYHLRGDKYEDK